MLQFGYLSTAPISALRRKLWYVLEQDFQNNLRQKSMCTHAPVCLASDLPEQFVCPSGRTDAISKLPMQIFC